ncbi:MAG: ATP-binding protein [bacterium]|nr:ATP-binding protein [bacterium]
MDLSLQNPWWIKKSRIDEDVHLAGLRDLSYVFQPEVLNGDDLVKDAVYTVRGPRQVGKTTTVKLLIKQLIGQDVNPRNIFYYSMDLVKNSREMYDIYLEWKNGVTDTPGRKWIFWDEATFVEDWEKGIKHIVDTFGLKGQTFILTGSSAVDLRKGTERLPGRRGIAFPDRVLLPVSFREYCHLKGFEPDLPPFETLSVEAVHESTGRLKLYYAEVDRLFREYLTTGGFLPAINCFAETGTITDQVSQQYRSVFLNDVEKIGRNRTIARDISAVLIESLGTPLSWNRFAKRAGSISPVTLANYITLFCDSFSLFYLKFFERHKKRGNPNKNKKIYPFDPLFYQVLSDIGGRDYKRLSHSFIVEGVVGNHLIRSQERNAIHGLADLDHVFYWKSQRGKEIDYLLYKNELILPLEVKFQKSIQPADYVTITKSFKRGIVLSKESFGGNENVIVVPVSCFLYLL